MAISGFHFLLRTMMWLFIIDIFSLTQLSFNICLIHFVKAQPLQRSYAYHYVFVDVMYITDFQKITLEINNTSIDKWLFTMYPK